MRSIAAAALAAVTAFAGIASGEERIASIERPRPRALRVDALLGYAFATNTYLATPYDVGAGMRIGYTLWSRLYVGAFGFVQHAKNFAPDVLAPPHPGPPVVYPASRVLVQAGAEVGAEWWAPWTIFRLYVGGGTGLWAGMNIAMPLGSSAFVGVDARYYTGVSDEAGGPSFVPSATWGVRF